MLDRPWSSNVFVASTLPSTFWQNLFVSLEQSVKTINDSEPTFEFQSQSISTLSLRFPLDQSLPDTLGWKISNNNKITANISKIESDMNNITSRVFLNIEQNPLVQVNCQTMYVCDMLCNAQLFTMDYLLFF
jgi:hypothetical protein